MTKYIFVTGGVISGIGKGITTSSLGLLLQNAGYTVSPIKADPYLNIDAGTMNPLIHGETFVLEDGLETDQDLGHYERFLNVNLKSLNYMTQGQVYMSVLQRERQLKYKGECVEPIPHIPMEIIDRIEALAKDSKSDFVILEMGGTVGEYQTAPFLEVIRRMTLKYPGNVINIHVTYLPVPHHLGELKSKPAQQSVQFLFAAGIQPDIIVGRSEQMIDDMRKNKIATFSNTKIEDIFSNPDVTSIYEVPEVLEKQAITDRILSKFNLKPKKPINTLSKWKQFVKNSQSHTKSVEIGIIAKYIKSGEYSLEDSYICVIEALKHAAAVNKVKVNINWIDSSETEKSTEVLKQLDGIIVPQGWGSRGVEGKIKAIQFARENKVPYFGLCFGMQLAAVEFARNVLDMDDANSEEVNQKTPYPIIHIMELQKKHIENENYGGTIRLGAWPAKIRQGTKLYEIYKEHDDKDSLFHLPVVQERHRHRYEFNNDYRDQFEKNGMTIGATSPDDLLVEALELKNHPFFIGTQYHPELKSRPLAPHPLFVEFVKVCAS
jgi:CTP synthase